MTEFHIALIAASGIIINLILAIMGYIFASWNPILETFSKLSIYYAFWSIIPIGKLDGTKIFFGSRILWFSLLILTTLFLGISLSFVS